MYLHNPRSLRIPRRRKSSGLSVPAATPTLATTPGESNEELDWGLGPEWTELLSKDEASLAPCPTTVIHAMRLWLELSYQLLLRCESNVRYAGRDAEQMAVEKLDLKRLHDFTFALCLVGADQNTAETATERMRQAVEANSFKADKQMVEFTISCAILEVSKDEHTNDLIDRVSRVLNMVVDAGGNRTGTDHEGVIALIEPRAFQVRSRLIELVATFGKPRAPVLSVTSLSAENARRAAQVSDHLQLRKATQLPGELEASLGDHGTEFDE